MIWVGHVAYVRVLVRKREGERQVNLGTDGRMILKWTLLRIGVSGRLL
jgi:hypothetical protein